MSTAARTHAPALRWLHLALALFGIAAYLTSELAEDAGSGFLLHAYLGLATFGALTARLLAGLAGGPPFAFRSWLPWRRAQWRLAGADLAGLLKLELPDRPLHQGIAGLVQFFGLCVFAWMAGTGTILFMFDASASHDLVEAVEEAHEVGESLIPLFLTLHVGAVLAHLLHGQNLLGMLRPGSRGGA